MKNRRKKYRNLFKQEDFVTNAGLPNTRTRNAPNSSINSPYASTALRKGISRESARKTRKDCIEKEGRASDVGQSGILSKTAQCGMEIDRANSGIDKIFELFNLLK